MASCPACGAQALGSFCHQCGAWIPEAGPAVSQARSAPRSIWQGLTCLMLDLLIALLVVAGVSGAAAEPNYAELKLGGYVIVGLAAIFTLPLGIWALVNNWIEGKIMGGCGLAALAGTILYVAYV